MLLLACLLAMALDGHARERSQAIAWLESQQPAANARHHRATAAPKPPVQGRGLHYNDIGNVYEGQWQEGMRHGEGQQLYGGRLPDHFGPDVYNGQWENDNRWELPLHSLCTCCCFALLRHHCLLCLPAPACLLYREHNSCPPALFCALAASLCSPGLQVWQGQDDIRQWGCI